MRPATLIAVVLSVHAAPLIAAQTPARVLPGARVRASAPHLPRRQLLGVVTRLDPDTLVVDSSPVALSSLTRLEVSTGRRSHWLAGLAIGALVGAGVGAILGSNYRSGDEEICTPSTCALIGAGVLGLVGMPVGALVGGSIHTDR